MSLRLRLILSYAVLILALGLAAWWGVRTLTSDLTQALGETAASVGRSVFTVLRHEQRGAAISPNRETGEREAPDSDDRSASAEPTSGTAETTIAIALARAGDDADPELEATLRTLLHSRRDPAGDGNAADGGSGGQQREQLHVVVDGKSLSPQEFARHRASQPGHPGVHLVQQTAGQPPVLLVNDQGFNRSIPLPSAGVDAALERYTRQLGWGLLTLLAIGLALSIWLAQRVTRPLRSLSEAARAVGQGTLGAQAPEGGVPEVRETIDAFNRMSTQLRRLDAEAAQLRGDRELAELGEIGRGLAHSLRNPIHALGLSLEALAAQAADPSRAQELAHAGREQLQRVDQALRGFLTLSAANGALPQPVALREVVDDVLLEASQRAQGRVRFECSGDAGPISAVAAELRVMLHALVINALEASPDGGRVGVRIEAAGDGVRIDVTDDGDGVPEAVRERLFQPHLSGKAHGAGMGLYLAQRLARLRYAGNIELETTPPRGTRARLTLQHREPSHG